MRWTKREYDGIFRGCSLQLKIKLDTKALAQRQTPGAIETAAKRRMHHELHAAAIVKESLQNQIVLRRHHA
jgi:hypothetical protein